MLITHKEWVGGRWPLEGMRAGVYMEIGGKGKFILTHCG